MSCDDRVCRREDCCRSDRTVVSLERGADLATSTRVEQFLRDYCMILPGVHVQHFNVSTLT